MVPKAKLPDNISKLESTSTNSIRDCIRTGESQLAERYTYLLESAAFAPLLTGFLASS